MIRVRIPVGILSPAQAHVLAGIAMDYGCELMDATIRVALNRYFSNLPRKI